LITFPKSTSAPIFLLQTDKEFGKKIYIHFPESIVPEKMSLKLVGMD